MGFRDLEGGRVTGGYFGGFMGRCGSWPGLVRGAAGGGAVCSGDRPRTLGTGGGVGVEFVPVGPSPSESPRARALRLWARKGVPPPPPTYQRPCPPWGAFFPTSRLAPHCPLSVAATACTWWSPCRCPATTWRPTACSASANTRSGAPPPSRCPAGPARPRGPAHHGRPRPCTPRPRPPSLWLPFGAALPSDPIALQGEPGRGAGDPAPYFPPFPVPPATCSADSGRVPVVPWAPCTILGGEVAALWNPRF